MFWKKKKQEAGGKDLLAEVFHCFRHEVPKFRRKIEQLEQKIKQLECEHIFKFDSFSTFYIGDIASTKFINYSCIKCGKTLKKDWSSVTRKEQQALKLLNLIPKDWKFIGDKK